MQRMHLSSLTVVLYNLDAHGMFFGLKSKHNKTGVRHAKIKEQMSIETEVCTAPAPDMDCDSEYGRQRTLHQTVTVYDEDVTNKLTDTNPFVPVGDITVQSSRLHLNGRRPRATDSNKTATKILCVYHCSL